MPLKLQSSQITMEVHSPLTEVDQGVSRSTRPSRLNSASKRQLNSSRHLRCCRPSDVKTPLLGSRASSKGLRSRASTPGLASRGSAAGTQQHGSGMLKSRATWAPGTARQDALKTRKSAKVHIRAPQHWKNVGTFRIEP